MIEAFDLPYMQRALAELALLSVPAGLLGAWIVLRRLAFYTHAVGTATFPGLVVASVPFGVQEVESAHVQGRRNRDPSPSIDESLGEVEAHLPLVETPVDVRGPDV